MRGFPQSLATKQDYMNCLPMFPEETKRALRCLLADRFNWEITKELSAKGKGKEDETHRVLEQVRTNEETGEQETYFVQLEKKEDKNARMYQLGFTVKEIESLI